MTMDEDNFSRSEFLVELQGLRSSEQLIASRELVLLVVSSLLLLWYYNSSFELFFESSFGSPDTIFLRVATLLNTAAWSVWLLAIVSRMFTTREGPRDSYRKDGLHSAPLSARRIRIFDFLISILVGCQFVSISLGLYVLQIVL